MPIQMGIQEIVSVVGIVRMTAFTGFAPLGHGHRRTSTGNLVVVGLVTFGAAEAISAHVNIAVAVGPVQGFRHVGVFDRVTPSTTEVAFSAGLTTGIADIFGHHDQVDILGRHSGSGGRLFICARGVVAHKAIYSCLVREIEVLVLPSVSGVT
jgi:hypothetical protein